MKSAPPTPEPLVPAFRVPHPRPSPPLVAGSCVAGALLSLVLLAGCSSTDEGADPTVDVWIMRDSLTEELIAQFQEEFEGEHPDVGLNIQIQEWDGIGQRVTAALASNDAPDIIETGNSQVAQYAASGGLTDLSDRVDELGGEDWLPGLAEPGAFEGRQYGIPFYGANRVVIYNTELWEAAGLTEPPRDREEWLEYSEILDGGDQQGIYLPGQNWYVFAGFLWDEGGDFAVEDDGEWTGTLDTPEAAAAMEYYAQLQAHGNGPRDSDEAEPPQIEVMAGGDVGQIISAPGGAAGIVEANPELAGKLGFFPIPGPTDELSGTVFVGGSDLVIPAASGNPDAAYTVLQALVGEEWQRRIAAEMNYAPNKTTLTDALADNEGAGVMAQAAADNGRATPNSPEWAAVEASGVIKEFQTAVLTGTDPAEAGARVSETITSTLNAG
ncbi:extracellular solute-binding protein [Nocardiopsis ganjiahuensis]|uniref:extracellular solute-binding protein n=1 Tax=Nocardiopsis ganjiahuensis TaxID=239984 RepID=UPI000346BA06|nr:extracellular solute-binding protein [Nocardiopsis ganjiahuensis]